METADTNGSEAMNNNNKNNIKTKIPKIYELYYIKEYMYYLTD